MAALESVPFEPSSATVTVTGIELVPPGTGESTVMANSLEPVPPASTVPVFSVQTDPALPSGRQTQPPEDAPGLNVELAGTAAVSVVPVEPRVPIFS